MKRGDLRFSAEVVDAWRSDGGERHAAIIGDGLDLRAEFETVDLLQVGQRVEVSIRLVKPTVSMSDPYHDMAVTYGIARVASALVELAASSDRAEPSEQRERLLELLKRDAEHKVTQ